MSPRTALRATALLLTLVAGSGAFAAQPPATLAPGGDLAFASYAFAPELGSGIYESNGRALQIYRLPFAFDQEGWRLTLPVTVGLLDFRSSDVIDLNLPRGVGSVSVVPGIERDFFITPNWSLTQFSKAGYTKTSGNADDAVLIGLGLRSNLRRPGVTLDEDGAVKPRAFEYLIYHELNLAIADLRGKLPGDHFLRLRTAVEGDLATPLRLGEHRLRLAPYVILDDYINPPTSPLTGRDADHYQKEIGFSLSLAPSPSRLGVPLPALGVSYRIAGELSGWRLAIGAPF